MIELTVAPSLREYAASSASLVSLDPAVMAEHGLKAGDLLRITTFRREILARVDASNDEDRGSGHIRLDRFQRQALQARLYARVELAPEGERAVKKVRLQPAVDLSTASAHHIEEHLKEELVESRSPVAAGALMFLHFHHSVAGTLFQVAEVQPGAGVVSDDTDVVLDAAPGGFKGSVALEVTFDEPLLQPGRFGTLIGLALPDAAERAEILSLYLGKHGPAPTMEGALAQLASRTDGSSSAHLRALAEFMVREGTGPQGTVSWEALFKRWEGRAVRGALALRSGRISE